MHEKLEAKLKKSGMGGQVPVSQIGVIRCSPLSSRLSAAHGEISPLVSLSRDGRGRSIVVTLEGKYTFRRYFIIRGFIKKIFIFLVNPDIIAIFVP